MKKNLDLKTIRAFKKYLLDEERSKATIDKYIRDVSTFYRFLPNGKHITKEILISYKESLCEMYKVTSINSMLVAVNGLLNFMDLNEYCLKLLKVQKKTFYEEERGLTKDEYKRLLNSAYHCGNERLFMLLQTICGTGIRVSEHKFITVEALHQGIASVQNKGKLRTIFITKNLCNNLKMYCKKHNIESGPIFITKGGKPMDRSNIWGQMKRLCDMANVAQHKVFPHNLRHLFALTYYRLQKDVVRLADILGHSSIETTRIYTMISDKECLHSLAKMDLVDIFCKKKVTT